MKAFGTVFFALCMFFVGWVLLAGTPLGRIERTCKPTEWVGRAMTALVAIGGSDRAEAKSRAASGEVTKSCQFFVFRVFYAEELARQQALLEQARAGAEPAPAPAASRAEGSR